MGSLSRAKQERVIEAVRHGLDGEAAAEFMHDAGFKLNATGISRHLKAMGGRARVEELISGGHSNRGIMAICFPADADVEEAAPSSSRASAFENALPSAILPFGHVVPSQFETTKLTVVIPSDLHEALKIASRIENKSRNDLIVEILTSALSSMPALPEVVD